MPTYWVTWGWYNFLLFCDMAVLLTCVALWRGSALLLSSQAVAAIVPNLLWMADAGGRLIFGQHPLGGTEYMWDARYSLWVRLLSLFHVVWPPLLLWALRRTGYDPRGFKLQSGIALALMVVSRVAMNWVDTAKNLNYVLKDPIFHRAWGPAPTHLAISYAVLVLVIYWPVHWILKRTYPSAPHGAERVSGPVPK
jgi:hypothetical protein